MQQANREKLRRAPPPAAATGAGSGLVMAAAAGNRFGERVAGEGGCLIPGAARQALRQAAARGPALEQSIVRGDQLPSLVGELIEELLAAFRLVTHWQFALQIRRSATRRSSW